MRVYIAGPMRGYEKFNFPAFEEAAKTLRLQGYEVVSPHELDIDIGFNPETDSLEDFDMDGAVRRDIEAIIECDAVVVLPGWERSSGAKAESAVAWWMGKRVLGVYPELNVITPTKSVRAAEDDVLVEALEITSGDRQASYGPPDQDFRRTAGMWTSLFGHLLKDGCAFEPGHIAMAMIALKLSRQIHQRKRDNWVDIGGYARCGNMCDEVSA